MPGMPKRNLAWAQRRVEADGKPLRLTTYCLLEGMPGEAWREWSREDRESAMAAFVDVGEQLRFDGAGEPHVVPAATGGRSRSEVAHKEAVVLRAERSARLKWERVLEKKSREAFAAGYAQATAEFGPKVVELEAEFLERAGDADATDQDRKLGLAVIKDWKDRVMGRPTQAIELSKPEGDSPARRALEGVVVRPASADVLVDEVAEAHSLELEAGAVIVEDAE